ncbi:MAG: hypothetical protein LH632_10035 [Rhodoferax sp.]|nr:hypothetical protein [Rhodoferax sp.]
MGPIDGINHLFNLVMPGFAVALCMAATIHWLLPPRHGVPGFGLCLAVNLAVTLLVLLGGLWFFGRDGKMASLAALVFASASAQWLLERGWRA